MNAPKTESEKIKFIIDCSKMGMTIEQVSISLGVSIDNIRDLCNDGEFIYGCNSKANESIFIGELIEFEKKYGARRLTHCFLRNRHIKTVKKTLKSAGIEFIKPERQARRKDCRMWKQTVAKIEICKEMYASGCTLQQCSDRVGVTRERVRQWFVMVGFPTRKNKKYTAEEIEIVRNLFREGLPTKLISNKTNMSTVSVNEFVKDIRAEIDNKTKKEKTEKAYKMYLDGYKLADCAESVCIATSTLIRYMEIQGLKKTRKRTQKN